MQRVMEENLSWRGARHPWLDWFPSAGSIFKKIEGVGAGRLDRPVRTQRLSPRRRADLHHSRQHHGEPRRRDGRDVRAVIATAQERVHEKFGYRLEPEIGFIGEF